VYTGLMWVDFKLKVDGFIFYFYLGHWVSIYFALRNSARALTETYGESLSPTVNTILIKNLH
jgi:hypothetical protein